MSKKKAKKNLQQGTYALCITTGLILGFGFGAITSNVLVSTIIGIVLGVIAGYLINRPKRKT